MKKEVFVPDPRSHLDERRTAAYADFVRRFPAYAATTAVDELRAADYARLDRLGHTYLDYTGGGLYAESQVRRHQELLAARVLGNPHSLSPTSLASSGLAKEARDAVRRTVVEKMTIFGSVGKSVTQ